MAVLYAVIPESGDTSQTLQFGTKRTGTFQMPAAFTGSTVAIKYSNNGTSWTNVPITSPETNPVTIAASGTYLLPARTSDALYFQLVSNGTEAAARTIVCHLRGHEA